jgi:hypothetical protein
MNSAQTSPQGAVPRTHMSKLLRPRRPNPGPDPDANLSQTSAGYQQSRHSIFSQSSAHASTTSDRPRLLLEFPPPSEYGQAASSSSQASRTPSQTDYPGTAICLERGNDLSSNRRATPGTREGTSFEGRANSGEYREVTVERKGGSSSGDCSSSPSLICSPG